jgi:hypothetical protein
MGMGMGWGRGQRLGELGGVHSQLLNRLVRKISTANSVSIRLARGADRKPEVKQLQKNRRLGVSHFQSWCYEKQTKKSLTHKSIRGRYCRVRLGSSHGFYFAFWNYRL